MDKTQALQNLLNGTASEEEINLLKGGLASGEISIGGNINQSVIIIGSGNTVELPPAALDRLGGRSLLGDLDRDLTGGEIAVGLKRLESKLPLCAPVLSVQFQAQSRRLSLFLKSNAKSLSALALQARIEALAQINSLCMEALDISFNALCLGEEPPEYDLRSPFRGLESFRPEDSEFFFGREALTKKLVDKIRSHSFLAVLGASGSGKSSLVMAGLIPALGSDYVIFRPGTNPLEALEAVKENALVVVDQFEELFTLARDEGTRKEFIAKLLETIKRNKVVITLRSDFLGEVAAYRNLNEEVQTHLENVPPMDMNELRRAMEGQADVVGLRFEADLSQQILDDVEGEPGAMPLLQHALWELWNRRHGRNLRASEYRAFGGVKHAITSTAEKVYGECTNAEQEQMRDIFLRLTRLDESDKRRDSRRRIVLSDLIPSGRDMTSMALLLDKFVNARLIVKTVNENKIEVEVAHEALIRNWERLQNWSDDNRRFLIWRQKINDRYLEWEQNEGDLLQGSHLIEAKYWLLEQGSQFSTGEKKYIEESIAYRSNRQKLLSNLNMRVNLPYFLLAIIVSVIGVYVVTRLVSNTIQERLTNQLLEAGRVVSDSFVRQEVRHVETARIIAYTTGLADALAREDRETALALAKPVSAGLGIENLILISGQGHELVHLVLNNEGNLQRVEQDTGAAMSIIVVPFLVNRNPEEPPRRALGINLVKNGIYYYTSLPVSLGGKFSGVVVVGTSIHNMLPFLKSVALADVIIYGSDGQAIGSTLGAGDQDALSLLSITPEDYQQSILFKEVEIVKGIDIEIDGRSYSIARGPLQVGNDRIGVFAVVLPLDYVIQSTLNSRTTYVILFTVVFFLVLAIGFVGIRAAINPLYSLEKTSPSNREKRQLILFILFIPAGIFLMLSAGQFAIRRVPEWSVEAGMQSNLNPNNLLKKQNGLMQPISPEIMTPLGWFDTFLTPNSESVDPIRFPSLVEFELSATPSPSPTTTKTATKTASPTATVTPLPNTTSTLP